MLMIDLRRFPADFLTDLVDRSYGDWLRVSFIGRAGQIYLKFYAAVARNEARDLADLRALAPTETEVDRAARWLVEEEVVSKAEVPRLARIVSELGHHDLISTIEALAE
jgi:hypothetical protein